MERNAAVTINIGVRRYRRVLNIDPLVRLVWALLTYLAWGFCSICHVIIQQPPPGGDSKQGARE